MPWNEYFFYRGKLDVGLVYDKGNNVKDSIEGFVNSNYDCDLDKRRPLADYVFTLSKYAISWKVIF